MGDPNLNSNSQSVRTDLALEAFDRWHKKIKDSAGTGRGDGDDGRTSHSDSASDEDLMLEDHPPGKALAMLKSKVVHRLKNLPGFHMI